MYVFSCDIGIVKSMVFTQILENLNISECGELDNTSKIDITVCSHF